MDRREFSNRLLLGIAGVLSGVELLSSADASGAPVRGPSFPGPLPREVAGLPVPDSAVAVRAAMLAREVCEPSLFNHCARTYVFAGLLGVNQKLTVDRELLFLASILHDLGLTERYMGPSRFEVQGANAARELLADYGVPAVRATVVHDAILMHATEFIAATRQPEIALVSMATATDVVGNRLGEFSEGQLFDILTAFPRLGFKRAFINDCSTVIGRYPGAAGGFMRDIGIREVPRFRHPNICDAIAASPFSE